MSGKHSFAVVAAESLALFVNAAELSVADYCVLCTSGPVLSIEGLRSKTDKAPSLVTPLFNFLGR